jgi:hypothetical protein|tara:strand:- start:696 stop:1295 length:600 start_codon:yes stop_codon:yes gene_type:complete
MKKNKKGRVKNVQSTKIDGIEFRSRLEAFTYAELKKEGIKFDYEKEKFVLLDKLKYEGVSIEKRKKKGKLVFDQALSSIRSTTYLPDFTNLKDGWIIEVKGLKSDVFNLKWKLFKHYLVKNNLNYELYMPGSKKQILQCIDMIKEKIKISEADKKRIAKMVRRDSDIEAKNNGMDLRSKPYKNKKKYTRKSKHNVARNF